MEKQAYILCIKHSSQQANYAIIAANPPAQKTAGFLGLPSFLDPGKRSWIVILYSITFYIVHINHNDFTRGKFWINLS
jgi:hypothetical protein